MVATLTPPFRLGLGSETRKEAGSAVRQATDCGFCFPETRAAELHDNCALPCSGADPDGRVGTSQPIVLAGENTGLRHEPADSRLRANGVRT